MNNLLLIISVSLALLTGCAPSKVVLHQGNDAVVIQHLKSDADRTTWDRVEVWAVDDRFIGPTYVGATTTLAPGDRKLVIHMYFRRGIGPEYEAFAELRALLRPSANLRLNGKVDGTSVIVWLEDAATQAMVGETARAQWRVMPRVQSPVPIFIPAK
jgi:hypothetical protein